MGTFIRISEEEDEEDLFVFNEERRINSPHIINQA
jgi:hypothetical protein